jgi:phage terminase large subunit-like protein
MTDKKLEIDRTTEYAISVISGKILAGPMVRGVCQRHLNDLDGAGERGFYYDGKEAAEAIAFFEEILFLNGGQYEGKPFILLPWEAFIIGSLFGWKRKSDGMRRFRVAYIETAKGSGKSPLAAGIGMKGLVADNEPRAEIYAAATTQSQAMVLFRDACAFWDQSPELQKRLVPSGVGANRWNLAYLEKGSFFRAISSEKKQSGPRPHMVLLDEIHEHPDNTVIEMLRAGFKFRQQPLSFMITNSGFDKTSVCWEYHEMGEKIAIGIIENDEFFAYICSFDEVDIVDDKYLEDESLWHKVNPSLEYGLPGYDYVRGQIEEARGMPSKMSTVKRLCFCQWTDAENPWISSEVWIPCRDTDFSDDLLIGRRCWGGLDLSAVNDLTAFALMFEPSFNDTFWRLKVYFWLPGENLRRKSDTDHVPYNVWRDQGEVFTSKGSAINKTQVIRFIYKETIKYQLEGIAFDRHRVKDLLEFAEKDGIELAVGKWDKEKRVWNYDRPSGIKMLPFGQEARSMSPAIDRFETMLLQKELRHDGNPCLTWNAANVVISSDDSGYRKMSKRKSIGRIDGIVASVMACGIIEDKQIKSIYNNLSKEQILERLTI